MRQKEIGDAFVGIDLIFYPREAVAFIFINLVIHRAAALLDGIDNLLRFRLRAPRIVSSREQQQRRFDLIDEVDGGTIFV